MLEDALRFTFEKLTKEQLVDLAIMLTVEGLHSAGRKPKELKEHITECLFDTRLEAEKVLDFIQGCLNDYGEVSMGDLLEACGLTPKYTDHRIGWRAISGFNLKHINKGYLIELPKPIKL